MLLMQEVPSVAVDTRGGRTRLLVGTRYEHWGTSVRRSDDLGATWSEPEQGGVRFGEADGAALARIWQTQPDNEARPGVVWAGGEESGVHLGTRAGDVYASRDGGRTFVTVARGLPDVLSLRAALVQGGAGPVGLGAAALVGA